MLSLNFEGTSLLLVLLALRMLYVVFRHIKRVALRVGNIYIYIYHHFKNIRSLSHIPSGSYLEYKNVTSGTFHGSLWPCFLIRSSSNKITVWNLHIHRDICLRRCAFACHRERMSIIDGGTSPVDAKENGTYAPTYCYWDHVRTTTCIQRWLASINLKIHNSENC